MKFNQIQVRESEVQELKNLLETVPCDVKVSKPSGRTSYVVFTPYPRIKPTQVKAKLTSCYKAISPVSMWKTLGWSRILATSLKTLGASSEPYLKSLSVANGQI